MSAPFVIHVVDSDHVRRAQLARCAFALGHHAEVYSDSQELAAHPPSSGMVLALEDAVEGGVGELLDMLNRDGRWLSVITTSVTPSVEKAVAALKQGATDYLGLPLDPERLARSLDDAHRETVAVQRRSQRKARAREAISQLSVRERQVLELMASGMTNKHIALDLRISPRTVEIHRTNLIAKLHARHSAEAIRMWFEAEFEADTSDDRARYATAR